MKRIIPLFLLFAVFASAIVWGQKEKTEGKMPDPHAELKKSIE